MKNYASNRTHKGRVAYRTPSRWLAGRPERFKKMPDTKLHVTDVLVRRFGTGKKVIR